MNRKDKIEEGYFDPITAAYEENNVEYPAYLRISGNLMESQENPEDEKDDIRNSTYKSKSPLSRDIQTIKKFLHDYSDQRSSLANNSNSSKGKKTEENELDTDMVNIGDDQIDEEDGEAEEEQ